MARVLIVDDSPTETQKIKSILIKNGHEVIEAGGGQEGVDATKAEMPDVVLMDIVMPGVNGFQATRQIKKNDSTSHIPVIIVTTKNQDTDRIWSQRQGAVGYLVKPIDEKKLASLYCLMKLTVGLPVRFIIAGFSGFSVSWLFLLLVLVSILRRRLSEKLNKAFLLEKACQSMFGF